MQARRAICTNSMPDSKGRRSILEASGVPQRSKSRVRNQRRGHAVRLEQVTLDDLV